MGLSIERQTSRNHPRQTREDSLPTCVSYGSLLISAGHPKPTGGRQRPPRQAVQAHNTYVNAMMRQNFPTTERQQVSGTA
jgi:hypothetical protein